MEGQEVVMIPKVLWLEYGGKMTITEELKPRD